jgi:predicted house-cleaning NTP pyrophosphatase (Maf/HAM1 superfamily)
MDREEEFVAAREGSRRRRRLLQQLNLRAEECRVVLDDLPLPERYHHPLAQEAARIAREALTAAVEAADYNAEIIAAIEAFLSLARRGA